MWLQKYKDNIMGYLQYLKQPQHVVSTIFEVQIVFRSAFYSYFCVIHSIECRREIQQKCMKFREHLILNFAFSFNHCLSRQTLLVGDTSMYSLKLCQSRFLIKTFKKFSQASSSEHQRQNVRLLDHPYRIYKGIPREGF